MLFTTFGDIDGDGDIDILGFSNDMYSYNMNFLFIMKILEQQALLNLLLLLQINLD